MALSVLQSYLVSLGFKVNNSEFDKAKQTLDSLGKIVQSNTAGIARSFAGAATAVVGALVTITGATAGMVNSVAKADLEYQKLATRMWTTKAVAKDLKTVLDAMGESFEDVALNPELRSQFMELKALGHTMQAPTDSTGQLKGVRGLVFEFTKLKLAATYAMEWISYYLIKYFKGPLKDVSATFKELRDSFFTQMPNWTKKVASGLASVINLLVAGGRFIKGLWEGFTSILKRLPGNLGSVTGAVAALWAIFKLTPLGKATALITGFLVLIEDFFAYIDGKESSQTLAPVWKFLIEWFNIAKNALGPINDLIRMLIDLFSDLLDTMVENGTLEFVVELFLSLRDAIFSMTAGFVNLIKETADFFKVASGNQATRSLWDWFKNTLSFIIKLMSLLTRTFVNLFEVIGLAMQGKFSEASKVGKQILENFKKDMDKIFDTSPSNKSKGGTGGGDFEDFVAAISGQESGGNYGAQNARTGAYGKYQIMPGNWPSWSKEAGLPAGSPMTPENQEIVARFKLKQYYDKYGAEGAAIAWYAGEGAVNYSEATKNRKQGNGDEPSMNEYAQSILARMRKNRAQRIKDNPASYSNTSSNTSLDLGGFTPSVAPTYQSYGLGVDYSKMGGGGNNYITNVGDININKTNASPQEVGDAVQNAIRQAQDKQIALQIRETSGVLA